MSSPELADNPMAEKDLLRDLIVTHEMTHPAPEDVVLPSRDDGSLSSSQIARIVYEVCSAAGVSKPWEPHQFCRSCATLMLEASVEFSVVSKGILAHASPETTGG